MRSGTARVPRWSDLALVVPFEFREVTPATPSSHRRGSQQAPPAQHDLDLVGGCLDPIPPAAIAGLHQSSIACSKAGHAVTPANRSPVNRSAASLRVSSLVRSASVIRRVSLRE